MLVWPFALALISSGIASQPAPAPAGASPLHAAEALDHVLVWTADVDRATSTLAVRMGFQVRPGGSFPDGVANRIVRFPDSSYLELLYFTRPEQELSGEALEEYRFTSRSGGGANSFALAVDDVDGTRSHLSAKGFSLGNPDPFAYDPDGDGPRPPVVMWKTVVFAERQLAPSSLFFIDYDLPPPSPERAADEIALTRHPNGAIGISAVWLLSADISADRQKLERMGFRAGPEIRLPHLAASGIRFDLGNEAIVLLRPEGAGAASQALERRGPHLYAVSVAVSDLGRAQRILERGYGRGLDRYSGPMGEAVSAPSLDELGVVVEFHQAAQ